jgi:hypothetical protein
MGQTFAGRQSILPYCLQPEIRVITSIAGFAKRLRAQMRGRALHLQCTYNILERRLKHPVAGGQVTDMEETPAVPEKGLPTPTPNLTIRMTPQFREWLDKAAGHSRLNISRFIEIAVIAHAKQQGFHETPPRR